MRNRVTKLHSSVVQNNNNIHPVDNAISVPKTYPLGSDLSDAKCYPTFEQPVPERINTSNGMSEYAGCIKYLWLLKT